MDEFLTAAVVGTAHYKNALPTTQSALDTLASQISSEQKERIFLLTAGARALYLQAGNRAAEAAEPMTPAAAEVLPVCSARVTHLITDLLQTANSLLLPEALQHLRQRQQRVPHQILPACLIFGAQNKEYRADLVPVLGERGYWLSQFNAGWYWVNEALLETNDALPINAETLWQEGTFEQRCTILQRLRAQEPERARVWLEAVWKDEKAETRITFLSCLQVGISSNDQAFIEQALDDRSEGVRQVAVSLLHLLPDSPHIQKTIKAISEIIDYKKSIFRQQFTITLPQPATLEWKNAISISKLKQDNHDAAYWLHHAFSHISPRHWEDQFSSTPEKLVALIKNAQSGDEILVDIMQAAILHSTMNWYIPLLEWYMHADSPPQMHEVCRKMLSALPPATREAIVAPLLTDHQHWEQAIHLLPGPWSSAFSHQCLNMLKNVARANDPGAYTFWERALPVVTLGLHPSCFALTQELDNLPVPEKPSWQLQQQQRHIATFTGHIQLRKRILEEI